MVHPVDPCLVASQEKLREIQEALDSNPSCPMKLIAYKFYQFSEAEVGAGGCWWVLVGEGGCHVLFWSL